MEQLVTCCYCNRTEHLSYCIVCKKLICGHHRVGTGALENGYACDSGDCTGTMMSAFIFGSDAVTPARPSSILRRAWLNRWELLSYLSIALAALMGIWIALTGPYDATPK